MSKPKNLLVIVNALREGGAEHMIYELVKSLNRDAYSPTVLCYGNRQHTALEERMQTVCPVQFLGLSGRITPATMRRVLAAMCRLRPDVVHAHMGGLTFALPWCALHRKPLCLTVHSKPQQAFSSLNNRMLRLFKHTLRLMVVAVSKENLALVQDYYKLTDKNSRFINNGVDVEHFYREDHGVFTFINVARQDDNKNQQALIRALADLIQAGRQAQLILVGDGPCHGQLKDLTLALGVTEAVTFTGLVADPAPYYARSDVYVQTSFREALPLSVLEAMATGLPVVATDVGGLRDVVTHNGRLIPAGDDQALLGAMQEMMDAPRDAYEAMAQVSRQTVKRYSSTRMAERYEQTYDTLLAKRTKATG